MTRRWWSRVVAGVIATLVCADAARGADLARNPASIPAFQKSAGAWTAGDVLTVDSGGNTATFKPGGGGSGDVTDVGPGCASGACLTDGVATSGSTLLIWEGTTVDTNEFAISVPSNPSADITWTAPNSAASITFPSGTRTLATLDGTETLSNKTLTAPTIADFTNAGHDHQDADDGGVLDLNLATTGNYVATIAAGAGISGSSSTHGGTPTISWAPATQVNSVTLWDGANASRTLTADLSGTDPVITFSSGAVNVSTGTLQQGGTAVTLQSRTISTSTGLTGGGDLSANRTLALDYTSTLAGNPSLGAGECVFASGSSERGIVCEGATADGIELGLSFPDPVTSDKTVTLPNATTTLVGTNTTDTLTNKTLTTPTIGDFSNATHSHQNSAGGGTLSITSATTGTLTLARGGTNQTSWTADRCVRVNSAGTALEAASDDCGLATAAPVGASYVTLATNGTLTSERVLTEGTAIDITDAGAGSSVTVDWDSTELGTTTFGSGSAITWTFNASVGTDCALAFGNGSIDATNCSLYQGGTAVLTTARILTGGAGIATIGNLSVDRTISTDSTEANFLASGALTCGASTQGKMQVHTTPLQYCDNAATPALQYAAYGNSSGAATGLACTSCVDLASEITGTLPAGNGGTGQSSYAQGDLLYASTSSNLTTLAKSTSSTRYLSNTGSSNNPAWAQVALATGVSGTLPATNGGTGSSSFTKGDLLVANSSTTLLLLAVGTDGQVLQADSAQVAGVKWASVAGDITDVWGCTSGNCNALTGAAGDSLDAGSADAIRPAVRSTTLPGTCTEGDAYQDTDSGGTEFYTCTATNTWTKHLAGVDLDTSAELATLVTDETGSGALVFATAPALTGPATVGLTSTATGGSATALASTITANPASGNAGFYGLQGTATTSAGASVGGLVGGVNAVGTCPSANLCAGVYGVVAEAYNDSATGSTDVVAVYARGGNIDGTGGLTNYYGLLVEDPFTSGGITNKYAIRTNGTGITSLGGNLVLRGSSSGSVTLSAGTSPAAQTYTLPSAAPGANGDALVSTTGGTMSWATRLAAADIDTSAELRAILTDETGSGGAAVFATSPTLTTATLSGGATGSFTSTATSGALYGYDGTITANPGSSSTGNYTAMRGTATTNTGASTLAATSGLAGVIGIGEYNIASTGSTSGIAYGGQFIGRKANTGAFGTLYGVYAQVANTNATGAVTNAYGVYIADSTTTGTITNDYGLYQAGTEPNYMAGALGLNTTAVPHGGIGQAKLAIDGANASSSAGPVVQFTTASDDYPVMAIVPYGHPAFGVDGGALAWDAYYDGSWRSSTSYTNYRIGTGTFGLSIDGASGVTAGNAITWNSRLLFSTTGAIYNFTGADYDFSVYGDTVTDLLTVDAGTDTVKVNNKLVITAPSAGTELLNLTTTTTGDDPTERVVMLRGTTTDGTANVSLGTVLTLTASTNQLVECRILSRRTGGSSGAANDQGTYVRRATYKGTAVVTGVETLGTDREDQAGWDATLGVSGSNLQVQVTGATNNNVTWQAICRYSLMAS